MGERTYLCIWGIGTLGVGSVGMVGGCILGGGCWLMGRLVRIYVYIGCILQ